MTEEQARRALSEIGSPAANPDNYQARRIQGGWAFGWRENAGPPLVGTKGWVVADNGRSGTQKMSETAEETVQRLAESEPNKSQD